ncbi:MAG TPA: 23S rRNA (uracil(1939)-C(5))-methyltransferase RlmD [Bacteroidales bacterium]|nr:23S rRNA (uracil(1939)-C(5))-methyltransferase RlmD [Bacteroidales bacterium]
MGRKKKLPVYENITIEDIAAEGKSIAKVNDIIVFVKGPVPGDIVDLQVTRKRKKFQEARVVKYHSYSKLRAEPFCDHFGTCGGCKWQHLPYSEQIRYKEQQVKDALKRIGKADIRKFRPILGCEKTRFYRNKLEYTFSNHRWLSDEEASSDRIIENRNALGFHVPGRYDRIVDVEKCHLQEDPSNEIRNEIKNFVLEKELTFYDHNTNEGFLRNLIIRTTSTGETMVILSVQFDEPVLYEILEHIAQKFSSLTSLMYVVNPKKNETLFDQDINTFKGRDYIFEVIDELKFKIGPKSFFQTNTYQAAELYRRTKQYADLTGQEIVYDLYTGTGTIANYIAAEAKQVIGIESVPEAIEDAKINSELNNISNTRFFAGDMKEIFTREFIEKNGTPDVIITDPPRAGMHSDVVEEILRISPSRIVYVSCNPATQARDLELLGVTYTALESQPVDMFPHTHHVENILLLERKKG